MGDSSSPETGGILSSFSFVSERGVLSSLYVGIVAFVVVVTNQQLAIGTDAYLWLAAICVILGLVASSVTYELFVPLLRHLSEPFVLWSFHRTVNSNSLAHISNYAELRKFRELFLSSDNHEHLKTAIRIEERLLQTLTYLASTSILALVILVLARQYLNTSRGLVLASSVFAVYVLIASLIGEMARSSSIGRAIGIAFLSQEETNIVHVTHQPAGEQGKPTLCLDFDGVLHWYRNEWIDATIIDDIPVPGAQEFLYRAQEHFRLVVFSRRNHEPGGIIAMQQWMKTHNFPEVEFPLTKPRASVILDDRAITFIGQWPSIDALLSFKPWRKQ